MADERIISVPPFDFVPNPKGLGWQLFEGLTAHKNIITQVCAKTGVEETCASVLSRCVRTAITIQELNIKPGEVISLITNNHLNSTVAWIAGIFAGCLISSIDPTYSTEDFKRILDCTKPKLIFVTPEVVEKVERAINDADYATKIVVFGDTNQYVPFLRFIRHRSEEEEAKFEPVPCKDLKDTVIIAYSSGSTGFPKGICLPHYGLLCQCYMKTLPENLRFMQYTTLYGINLIHLTTLCVMNGCTRVIANNFCPKTFWHHVSVAKVMLVTLAPHELLTLIQNEIPKDVGTSTLKYMIVGGASMSGDQLVEARKAIPTVLIIQAMGQTEACGGIFRLPHEEEFPVAATKPASVGKLNNGFTVKIVDPESNQLLGANQVGELRIKSNFLLNGYYKRDCSEIYDKDGWYKSGDLMYYDEDGYFYHVDRIKEMFKYRLIHIQPAVLEEVLASHPALVNAAVIGKPHPEDGHWPMGVVILKDGMEGKVSKEDIINYHNDRVDDPKKLRGGLVFVKELPTTVSGKVLRRQLKQMLLDDKLL